MLVAAFVLVLVTWPARLGGHLGLTVVAGHSMDGTYRSGDLLMTWRQPHYGRRDVVVFVIPDPTLPGYRVVHRITRTTSDGRYSTRGDNAESTDPWLITDSDVEGSVVGRLPSGSVPGGAPALRLAAVVITAGFVSRFAYRLVAAPATTLVDDTGLEPVLAE
jgi:signal peptidase